MKGLISHQLKWCVKNMRAWVSMVSCLKNFRKIIPGREKKLKEVFWICLLNSTANPAHFHPIWGVLFKSQSILKQNFSVFNSSNKRNYFFSLVCWAQKFFVHFLEELKQTKSQFEVTWHTVILEYFNIRE